MRKRPLKNRWALKKKCYGKRDLETCMSRFDVAFCHTEKHFSIMTSVNSLIFDFWDVTRSFLKVGLS